MRINTLEKKFVGLDHLRALAIILVVLCHYRSFNHPAWLTDIFGFGWTGVDLFFVLSGFLISNQLFTEIQRRDDISLRNFYTKRAFRILPPYFFILLIYIFIPAFHEREQLSPLWKMFTFTQNLGVNISVYGTFSHSWSLCVEEQFYLLFPLLLLFLLKSGRLKRSTWLIPTIFVLSILLRLIIWHFILKPLEDQDDFGRYWYQWIYYPTDTRLDGLIVGVCVAAIYRFKPAWISWINQYANLMWILGIIFFVITFYVASDAHKRFSTIFGFSLVALCFGMLVFSAILPGSILFKSKSFLSRHLATLSYSVYLCHKGLIHVTQKVLDGYIHEDGTVMFFICIAVCILGAYLMRIFIEKPAMAIRDRYLEKLRQQAVPQEVIN
jgi:peptidoglycan/LPS O-acetylase OafA/YrhL